MNLIRGLHNLKIKFIGGCVATIGNYDGVHLGHQQILRYLKKKADELNVNAVVIIFEPQPDEFFSGNKSLRLTNLRDKIRLFSEYGINNVLILPFNSRLACISAIQFVEEVLFGTLHVRHLIIGDDFSFGHNREGDFNLLKRFIRSIGLHVDRIPSFKIDGIRVSSSLIRTALLHDKLEIAAQFLGRPYFVSGRIVHGEHLGRKIVFPTANICLPRRELLLDGIYAVKIFSIENNWSYGVANIGFCPTFSKKHKALEIYIFNFSANIYGKIVIVEFYKKIRNEIKFASPQELKLQIEKDIKKAQSFFKAIKTASKN